MEIDELIRGIPVARARLQQAREAIGLDFPWYLYDILSNRPPQ